MAPLLLPSAHRRPSQPAAWKRTTRWRLNRRWHGEEAVDRGRGDAGSWRYVRHWALRGLQLMEESTLPVDPRLGSPDQSFANGTLASVLVLVRTPSHMLVVDPLPDGLVRHGYCIMYEHPSIGERCTTAGLGCLLYLSFISYKAAVPYFTMSYLSSSVIIWGCYRIIYPRITMIRNCALISNMVFF